MKAFDWILSRQLQWADSAGIELIGSKGVSGRKAYTQILQDNLFEPMSAEVQRSFNEGNGKELSGRPDNPAKMQAVHSSSVLGVNIFHYWMGINQVPQIAYACGFCNSRNRHPKKIRFEAKFPVSNKFSRSPNIDVVIENSPKSPYRIYAIECKFSEAYSSRGHSGIALKYLELGNIWDDMPNLYNFAQSICPNDTEFNHLHPAQLIKHILGLSSVYGTGKFRLLYLWYDAICQEGAAHSDEINRFRAITKLDGIHFHSMSYQELIACLADKYRAEHKIYIDYISRRYL